MFNFSEDKIHDHVAKTMSIVFEGGQSAESRRITYAWRLRHLLLYNANRQETIANTLQLLYLIFALLSTVAAVMYIYFSWINIEVKSFYSGSMGMHALSLLTLLLPLCATILRGIYTIMNPATKKATLRRGALRVECEIYLYRAKVGRYHTRRFSKVDYAECTTCGRKHLEEKFGSNARKLFSASLDNTWNEISASGNPTLETCKCYTIPVFNILTKNI
jgi:hypothetical protein